MSNYQKIGAAFANIGLNQGTLVSETEIHRALNTLANTHGLDQYDPNVADQLWGQTPKANGSKAYLRDFISTVVKGQSLVRQSISNLERQVQQIRDPDLRNQAIQDIASYTQDLKYLTIPFGLGTPRESKILNQSGLANNRSALSGHSTVIFSKQIPQNQSGSSTDLKFAFLLTVLLTFIQIIIMFHKHHFYSLLAYLSIFSIFFLGYFDLHYMRFVKINLLVSVVLDLVWLFVNFTEYWTPQAETQHSSLQWGFLKFILFFVLGLAFLKVILIAVLFKYRNNPPNMRKTVSLLGQKYHLNGAQHSPIAKVINGDHNSGAIYNPPGFAY